ncbi:MAG: hypothetical protein ACLVJ6_01245 [Merdibacter sp.]
MINLGVTLQNTLASGERILSCGRRAARRRKPGRTRSATGI